MHPLLIQLNGKRYNVTTGNTIADLLRQEGLEGRRLAVEVNEVIIPKSRHEMYILKAGDRVEIVHAIGGG